MVIPMHEQLVIARRREDGLRPISGHLTRGEAEVAKTRQRPTLYNMQVGLGVKILKQVSALKLFSKGWVRYIDNVCQ